jgi:hypothetical protein
MRVLDGVVRGATDLVIRLLICLVGDISSTCTGRSERAGRGGESDTVYSMTGGLLN